MIDSESATNHIISSIAAYVDGDMDRAADALCAATPEETWQEVYGVCCALASMVLTLVDPEHDPNEMWAFEMLERDQPVNPDSVLEHRAKVWAMRFCTAFGNKDFETCLALFGATKSEDDAVENMATLWHLAGSLAKSKLEEQGQE